jgi:hypothetical protein
MTRPRRLDIALARPGNPVAFGTKRTSNGSALDGSLWCSERGSAKIRFVFVLGCSGALAPLPPWSHTEIDELIS